MKILVLSDIHANLSALKAILEAPGLEWDQALCLGDIVGYGPEPEECVQLVFEVCSVILAGNHDLAACNRIGIEDFSPHAYRAMEWTREHLSDSSKERLARLEPFRKTKEYCLSHGSPLDPIWSYIMNGEDARCTFSQLPPSQKLCFFGHTHIPSFFTQEIEGGAVKEYYGKGGMHVPLELEERRFLLNPGSVGFPRDLGEAHNSWRLPRAIARYALYDTEKKLWTFHRLEYDMGPTWEKMRRYNLS
ncbi:MAG: metallophosphoesterase family protein [Breznakiellaceae bacterium]